jgi:hypothetical protein
VKFAECVRAEFKREIQQIRKAKASLHTLWLKQLKLLDNP